MMGAIEGPVAAEAECIGKAQLGHEDALLSLLEHYRPMLRSIARRYFLPYGDTDDLIQEATIGFIKAIRDFRPGLGLPFRPFAELCATRQIITAVKTATRQKHLPLNTAVSLARPRFEDDSQTLADVVADDRTDSMEDIVVRQEETEVLSRAIQDVLSPYERRVIECYLRGLTFQEIADACRTHLKSVDNALWRVKCKLRRHYVGLTDVVDRLQRA